MFDSLFWAFVGLAVLVTITPGADTVLTIRNTLSDGTRAGIWTVAGICSGFIFQPLLAALGVAALFIKLPLAFAAVKFAGALYLVYLGGQSLREATRLWKARYSEVPVGARTNSDSWKRYREGLLTNALNPKIAVFYFAVLPRTRRGRSRTSRLRNARTAFAAIVEKVGQGCGRVTAEERKKAKAKQVEVKIS